MSSKSRSRRPIRKNNFEQINDDEERNKQIDDLISKNICIIKHHMLRQEEKKLKIKEEELKAQTKSLQELVEECNQIQSENNDLDCGLRKFQLLNKILNQCKDLEKIAKIMESISKERFPIYLDDVQFQKISDDIKSYEGQIDKNLEQIQEIMSNIINLKLNDGSINVDKLEVYKELEILNQKYTEQTKQLTDLNDSIKNLQKNLSKISDLK